MNLISKDILDSIIKQSNIIDIIGSKINIKKSGENFYSLCPFHKEKTPSFFINYKKRFFYCFGCKINGNVITFIMKFYNINFISSVKMLAKYLNIDINNNFKSSCSIKEKIFYINKKITFFYKRNLYTEKKAYHYIHKIRKISEKVLDEFDIGYCNNNLFNQKIFVKKYKQYLLKLNIIKKNNNFYEFFYNRIIFPIKDINGNIIGFGGRKIIDETVKIKYLNSSNNNIIFKKKEILYGIHQLSNKYYISNDIPIFIVEGYIDVISLAKYNILAVAPLGTAITILHIEILLKYNNNIIFFFDNDKAGKIALIKCMKILFNIINSKYKIKFFIGHKYKDPDNMINIVGKDNFLKIINKNSVIFSDFFLLYIKSILQNNSLEEKARILNIVKFYINKIQDRMLQIMISKKISKFFLIDIQELYKKNNINTNTKIYHQEQFYENFSLILIINDFRLIEKINYKEILLLDELNIRIKLLKAIVYIYIQNHYINKSSIIRNIKNENIKNLYLSLLKEKVFVLKQNIIWELRSALNYIFIHQINKKIFNSTNTINNKKYFDKHYIQFLILKKKKIELLNKENINNLKK